MTRRSIRPPEWNPKAAAASRSFSVSSVVGPGGSWREAFRRIGGPCHEAERLYLRAVLERYLWLPVTPAQLSRQDRRCARALYARQIPLEVVEGALLLAAARRVFRPKDAAPLRPIGALHYFLPVLNEVLAEPLAPDYKEYLIGRLRPLAEAKGCRSTGTRSSRIVSEAKSS